MQYAAKQSLTCFAAFVYILYDVPNNIRNILRRAKGMEMSQNVEMLKFIYQNTKMGEESIDAVLPAVHDNELANIIEAQRNGYTELSLKAHKQLIKHGEDVKDNSAFTKATLFAGVKLNTLTDKSSSHISEMMIQGSNMGVIDLTKKLNEYEEISPDVRGLVDEVVQFEQNSIQQLKNFL